MRKLSFLESFAYYMSCIGTIGGSWVLKIIIKKAIIESQNGK